MTGQEWADGVAASYADLAHRCDNTQFVVVAALIVAIAALVIAVAAYVRGDVIQQVLETLSGSASNYDGEKDNPL